MNEDPNSFDKEIENAQANSQPDQGTETETTANPIPEAEPEIDYKTKFAESSKEALRLYEENKRLAEELAAEQAFQPFVLPWPPPSIPESRRSVDDL